MTLILASTSPYRRALLERLGIPFESVDPTCDEDALKASYAATHDMEADEAPQKLAYFLAHAKADSIAHDRPDDCVIGSDQLLALNQEILGKPGDSASAVRQLLHLSGRSHQLITAVCVMYRGHCHAFTDIATLYMRELDQEAATRYVALDMPIDCAGAYKLEAAGISLFDDICASDHSAITGLPLMELCNMLRMCGFRIP